jgi:hypothetical protein
VCIRFSFCIYEILNEYARLKKNFSVLLRERDVFLCFTTERGVDSSPFSRVP